MTVGERLKRRRKELGMSAEAVAEKLGCSPSTVWGSRGLLIFEKFGYCIPIAYTEKRPSGASFIL